MFCGILPWTWFSSSLSEAANVADRRRQLDQEGALPGGSAADRQRADEHGALFPRPADPDRVSARLSPLSRSRRPPVVPGRRRHPAGVHDRAGARSLRRWRCISATSGHSVEPADALVFRDADHLSVVSAERAAVPCCSSTSNPFTHLAVSYQEILFFNGTSRPLEVAPGARRSVPSLLFLAAAIGYSIACAIRLRRRCEDRGCLRSPRVTPAIELANVSKVYRRYGGRQFATLKSALLQRSILRDLQPSETFPALTDVSFCVPKGSTFGVDGPQRIWQEHAAQAGRRHHQADKRHRAGGGRDLRADRARRRLSSGDLRSRERVHQRHHAGAHQARDPAALRRDRRFCRAAGVHRCAGEDLLVRDVHAPRLRRRDQRGSRRPAGRRGPRGRRRGFYPQVPGQVCRVQAPQQNHSARHALARIWSSGSATRRSGSTTAMRWRTAIPSGSSART